MRPAPFIVGLARSGTTLLRLMLDRHPELAIPPETHLLARALRSPPEAFCDLLVGSPQWPDFGLEEAELRRRVPPHDLAAAIRSFYVLYAEARGKPRWGDKTPPYLRVMAELAEVLPEATFVHVIRDGRDVSCSVVPLPFGPDSHEAAARAWVDGIAGARANPPPRYVEVRFEALVERPEETLRGLCEPLELAFDPVMLRAHETAGERLREIDRPGWFSESAEERVAIHALTREPPRADRVGAWRREMSDDDRRAYEAIARPMLAELGYR